MQNEIFMLLNISSYLYLISLDVNVKIFKLNLLSLYSKGTQPICKSVGKKSILLFPENRIDLGKEALNRLNNTEDISIIAKRELSKRQFNSEGLLLFEDYSE